MRGGVEHGHEEHPGPEHGGRAGRGGAEREEGRHQGPHEEEVQEDANEEHEARVQEPDRQTELLGFSNRTVLSNDGTVA